MEKQQRASQDHQINHQMAMMQEQNQKLSQKQEEMFT